MNYNDFKFLSFDCYGTLIDWESGIWNAFQPVILFNNRKDLIGTLKINDHPPCQSPHDGRLDGFDLDFHHRHEFFADFILLLDGVFGFRMRLDVVDELFVKTSGDFHVDDAAFGIRIDEFGVETRHVEKRAQDGPHVHVLERIRQSGFTVGRLSMERPDKVLEMIDGAFCERVNFSDDLRFGFGYSVGAGVTGRSGRFHAGVF